LKKHVYLSLFLLVLSREAFSQTRYESGLLPSLSLTKNINDTSRINLRVESRQSFFEKTENEPSEWTHTNVLTDITAVYSYKVGYNNALAAGYMTRFRDGTMGHRTIQQFTMVRPIDGYRIAHRFSTDQTWMPKTDISLRMRYRLASDLPLQGTSLDPNEFYLKASVEYLTGLQSGILEHEVRAVPVVGYDFTDNNKVEIGIDYRHSDLFTHSPKARYWFKIAWFRAF
jgi:hypothetical protein